MSEFRKVGRPKAGKEVYTPEIVDEFCTRLMAGETMLSICRDDHMPNRKTVTWWIRDKPEFYEKYLQARRVQMEFYVDEIIEISDDASGDIIETTDKDGKKVKIVDKARIFRDVLRVNSRKWLAAHLAPNLYSDRPQVSITNVIGAYDISKLGDKELAQLEQILSQVAIATGQNGLAALPPPIPAGVGPDIEGFALFGGDPEGEPEA